MGPHILFPAILNPPPGYNDLWSIERTEVESCAVRLKHINPGQTARVRFLMDELPRELPVFKCPMAGLQVKEQVKVEVNQFSQILLDVLSPGLGKLIKTMR